MIYNNKVKDMFRFCDNYPILFDNGCIYYYDTEVKNLIDGEVKNIRWVNSNYKRTTGRFLYIRSISNIERLKQTMSINVGLYQAECILSREFKSLPRKVKEAWNRLAHFTIEYIIPNLGIRRVILCDNIN